MTTYTAWDSVPDHLKTKTQLDKLGLKPAKGQEKVATFESLYYGKRRPRYYDLFDMGVAVKKRKPSPAQLAALEKGRKQAEINRRQAGTCPQCKVYYGERYLQSGVCIECFSENETAHARREMIAEAKEKWAQNPLFLDTETTGLHSRDQVIELAIVDVAGQVVLDTLMRPTIPIPAEATDIHGLTDQDVSGAPTFADLSVDLFALIKGRIIVTYNAVFDRQMLNQTAEAHGLTLPKARWVCAMGMFADFNQLERWVSLSDASHGCDIQSIHRALADALRCRYVFKEIVDAEA